MKTTDIKGKPYIEVNERLIHFRANYPDFRLISEIVSNGGGVVVMKASILNPAGETVAVGHAYEKEGSSFINKTSYIENCETSAWGRALANFGIGIDTAVASADEVGNAIRQQEDDHPITEDQAANIEALAVEVKANYEKFLEYFGISSVDEMPASRYDEAVRLLEKKRGQ